MSEEPTGGGFHIDSDWKEEAAQEKERLAEQERKEPVAPVSNRSPAGTGAGVAPATFAELINLLAMQAAIALGGMQGAGGERIPPNPLAARHHIDLLEVLQQKTEGNLTDDEKRALNGVLYELRMQYVQAVSAPPPPPSQDKSKE